MASEETASGEAASGETASGEEEEEGESAASVAEATFILLLKISQVRCSYLRNPLKLAVYRTEGQPASLEGEPDGLDVLCCSCSYVFCYCS